MKVCSLFSLVFLVTFAAWMNVHWRWVFRRAQEVS